MFLRNIAIGACHLPDSYPAVHAKRGYGASLKRKLHWRILAAFWLNRLR